MDTYITLSIFLICGVYFVYWLVKSLYEHDKKNFHTYDFPLDNKDKWWYN